MKSRYPNQLEYASHAGYIQHSFIMIDGVLIVIKLTTSTVQFTSRRSQSIPVLLTLCSTTYHSIEK